MMAMFTVGQQLPNGATVTSDDVQTLADGTTIETVHDSAGNVLITTTPVANSPLANAQTLRDRAAQALAANASYLGIASPTALQTTAQVKALTRQVNALARLLVVADTSTISDS